jgi:hypothetical protein
MDLGVTPPLALTQQQHSRLTFRRALFSSGGRGCSVHRMKVLACAVSLVLLSACATRSRVVGSYPDGSVAQEVDCVRDRPEKCMQRSRQLCQSFGREPQIVRPLVYDQYRERWTTVITCGAPNAGFAPPGIAAQPPGAPPQYAGQPPPYAGPPPQYAAPPPQYAAPPPQYAAPPPPASGYTPLPPNTPRSSSVPQ